MTHLLPAILLLAILLAACHRTDVNPAGPTVIVIVNEGRRPGTVRTWTPGRTPSADPATWPVMVSGTDNTTPTGTNAVTVTVPAPGSGSGTTPPPSSRADSSAFTACNQGRGNGPEGCDPGQSSRNRPSRDEPRD